MRNEIELRLQGSLLSDWCAQKAAQSDAFVYQRGFDSTHRIIRFSTKTLDMLFPPLTVPCGHWKNGRSVMYEIHNAADGILLSCTASPKALNQRDGKRMQALADACGATLRNNVYSLVSWNLSEGAASINQVIAELDQVFAFELRFFEAELTAWKEKCTQRIRPFSNLDQEVIRNTDLPETLYLEGAQKQILCNHYERNPKARARCIAAQGTACKVCGFDFGIAFGEVFASKIEVHHIKPISEIGEEYVVDPVRDLVPVCPNCHRMLHSKADGVYSIDELKALRESANN